METSFEDLKPLLLLLDDTKHYALVQERIIAFGVPAVQTLKEYARQHKENPLVQERIKEIIYLIYCKDRIDTLLGQPIFSLVSVLLRMELNDEMLYEALYNQMETLIKDMWLETNPHLMRAKNKEWVALGHLIVCLEQICKMRVVEEQGVDEALYLRLSALIIKKEAYAMTLLLWMLLIIDALKLPVGLYTLQDPLHLSTRTYVVGAEHDHWETKKRGISFYMPERKHCYFIGFDTEEAALVEKSNKSDFMYHYMFRLSQCLTGWEQKMYQQALYFF